VRITQLQAENFKRLKAVDITPDANTVVIGGRNAQGKTSVLDAIMAALAGKKGTKEITRPIRDGESKASVVVELDDLRVERKWTPAGSTVTVGPKDGSAKFNSPQAILDKLIGALSFDPLEFAEADSKTQVETLIDIIGREAFDRIAAERKDAYDNRTEINRDVKRLRAEVDSRADAKQVDPVDPARLSIELEAAIEVERAREEWQRIEDQITTLRERQAKMAQAAKDVVEKVNPRPSEEVRADLTRASEINHQAQRWVDLQSAREKLATAEEVSAKHTAFIESLDETKARLIAEAPLPIDGLTFDEEGVQYNGVPFAQASAAERLRVSVAMAMAMNPELKVICIRDASLLDNDSKAALVALATEHDYQIWYEVVGDAGEIGVVIEDGQVQA
jgi:predicted ATP-dependent endonuclease of OLD family